MKAVPLFFWLFSLLQPAGLDVADRGVVRCRQCGTQVAHAATQHGGGNSAPGDSRNSGLGASLFDEEDSLEDAAVDAVLPGAWVSRSHWSCIRPSVGPGLLDFVRTPSLFQPLRC